LGSCISSQQAEAADWASPIQVRNEYPNARIIAQNRIVFNIKGNKYRLIIKVNYKYQMVWIRFIGAHSEYDKIDAKTI